ncbi:MAG: phage/plasmid primase, P4 family [Gammaproteobacteria bacterium]
MRCPTHDDQIASLQIDDKGDKVLVHCHAGCDQSTVIGELKARGLWVNGHDTPTSKPRIVATYDYTDEHGTLLYQAVRYDPKGFKQRRPAGTDWTWNLMGVRPVPYQLPALIAGIENHNPVFIVEGEKDVAALADLGLVATCNAGGAGKWRSEWATIFAGADVYIAPDNDDAGRKHATQVLQSLQGVAASIAVLNLPGLPEKGDVSDWLAAGGDRERLLSLIEQAKPILARPSIIDSDSSDDGLALSFASSQPNYRRVAAWRSWMKYDGGRWAEDATLSIFTEVREFLRWRAKQENDNTARRLRSKQTVAAVESLAQSDRRYAATIDQWDADPWVLNTPGGVLDLRTGTLNQHAPEQYLTRQAAASPAAECPRWLTFLDEVTGGDAELAAYLQRMAGYCLTGRTTEHALFFFHGSGANGKSVFLSVLSGVLGDYATVAPMTAFVETRNEQHPTDLAGLRGARLVTASETEAGKAWNESRIKALTGGDSVTARFMRGDFFKFTPAFKLVIAGNHRPRLQTVDESMRRRLHMIPFEVTIPPDRRDADLTEKLRAEWPGILGWALVGCLDWQARGLDPPAAVRAATEQYISAQDTFGGWLADCCDRGPDKWDTPTRLFASWRTYAEAARERVGTQSGFIDRMEGAGIHQDRNRLRGRHWVGIAAKFTGGDVHP